MKPTLPLLLAIALAAPMGAFAADAHEHGKAAPHKLELNAGKKWSTDDALRQGMTTIHASVSQTLPAAHSGKAKASDYDAFGQTVSAQIAYIVENCKLDPKADEQLHGVIAQIMAGAETAQSSADTAKRVDGVTDVAKALNAYGDHFNHAGWKKIDLEH